MHGLDKSETDQPEKNHCGLFLRPDALPNANHFLAVDLG